MSSSRIRHRKPLRERNSVIGHTKPLKLKSTRTKPPWDDTVKDLTVFKPSRQELMRNHELHKPRKDHDRLINKINTTEYLLDGNNEFIDESYTSGILERKRALIKEVFRNQEKELNEILLETDRTLANVKDIFGDDAAQKYSGKPQITRAPHQTAYGNSLLLRQPDNEETVLNHIDSEDDMCDDSDAEGNYGNQSHPYKSQLNIERFEKIVSEKQGDDRCGVESDRNTISKFVTSDGNLRRDYKKQQSESENESKLQYTIENNKPEKNPLKSFADLQEMLSVLENEICEYENSTGKENVPVPHHRQTSSTLTGYTTNLLAAIIRLTRHLKDSDYQLQAEISMRKEILDALEEQKGLVDALTVDLLQTQEENQSLKQELELQKRSTQSQFANIKLDLTNLEKKIDLVCNMSFSQTRPNATRTTNQHEKPSVRFDLTSHIPYSSKQTTMISQHEFDNNNRVSPDISAITS